MYQPSFDRFSSVTTSRGAIAPDAIRKIVNSETPVEIEHDNPKDVIQNSSEAEYGEFMGNVERLWEIGVYCRRL